MTCHHLMKSEGKELELVIFVSLSCDSTALHLFPHLFFLVKQVLKDVLRSKHDSCLHTT